MVIAIYSRNRIRMKFEQYHIAPELKRSLEELNFRRPTDIQHKAIPPILAGEDVLAIAQTGTGKTAAFAIPLIQLIHEKKERNYPLGISCLVMVPTRELALQITKTFEAICKYTRVRPFCVFGGVEQDPQIAKLEKGIDILIATPGRMFDLVSQGYIELSYLDTLVLDEADHMLDLGFYGDIQDLLRFLPRTRQTLFFSATINEKIKDLAYSLVRKPIRIQISPKDPVSKNIDHSVTHIEMDDKRFFLERLIKENPDSKILVFVRTKVRAERVCKAMERVNLICGTIHGDKDQGERIDALKQFYDGTLKVLIATDVTARGIDIPNVNYVVNYDLPDVPENYVHRVGRTGRGVQRGIAVSFCSEEEKPILEEIEEFMGKKVKVLGIDKTDYTATIDFSEEPSNDWKSLMKEVIDFDEETARRKKKTVAKKKKK